MRTRELAWSTAELKTDRALRRALVRRGYRVCPKVRLSDALGYDLDEVTKGEAWLLRTGHFDYLVTSGDQATPILAVEFDGRHHAQPKQDGLDATKNRFCRDAGLALLRITSQELEPREQVSILDWILARWLAWPDERPSILEEIGEYVAELGTDHPLIRAARDEGMYDASFDPSVIFDIRHPYPAILAITQRLHKQGVVTMRACGRVVRRVLSLTSPGQVLQCVASQRRWYPDGDEWYTMEYEVVLSSWLPNQEEIALSGGDVLYRTTQCVTMRWALPVGWGARAGLRAAPQSGGMDEWLKWVEARARFLWPCDLPGASSYDIMEGLAEYLVLRDTERWVNRHRAGEPQ